MVTLTSGHSSCTARAMTWARSWRISSSAAAWSFIVLIDRCPPRVIGQARSMCAPSSVALIAAFARLGAIDCATSAAVTPAG